MVSGSQLNEALQLILDSFNKINIADVDIEAIKAENAQLRRKKMELMEKLNRYSTVKSSIVLLEDMLSRHQTVYQARYETKQEASTRSKLTSQEAAARVASWKKKLLEFDNFMTWPYSEVLQQVLEMEKTNADNHSKINELIPEHKKLSLNQKDETEDILKLHETLKYIEEEQRKLLEKVKEDVDLQEEIK